MFLSIVIATHNRPDTLAETLKTLEDAVKPKYEFEIIFVDNGTPSELMPLYAEISNRFSIPIRRISEKIAGKTRSVNIAIRAAKGRYIAFLDDDVLVHADYFVGIENTINQFPYRVFGGRILPVWPWPPPDWITGGKKLVNSRGPVIVHDYGQKPTPYLSGMRVPVGCNFFCERVLFEEHGFFNEKLGRTVKVGKSFLISSEDSELLQRFQKNGETLFYTPFVVVEHPVPPDRMTKKGFRQRMFVAGRSIPYIVEGPLPSIFGIPRYLFRVMARDILNVSKEFFSGNHYDRFEHELNICMELGAMYQFYKDSHK